MGGTSLLALIDDIASLLDDMATLTKIATQKTAGVLGDDLALNAQQVAGVDSDRELPVVWAVAKGSAKNKMILVPAALAISAIAPWGVTPLLICGGIFLCYEGVEKLAHRFLHSKAEDDAAQAELLKAVADPKVDLVTFEKDKILGAIRTDFVLSAEIIVIALGIVAQETFPRQVAVLCAVAVTMTIGVYGLVAIIVKLDDLGLFLTRRKGERRLRKFQRSLGRAILVAAPYLLRTLSVLGTVAMFMVGGGIITHGIPWMHHWIEDLAKKAGSMPTIGGVAEALSPLMLNTLGGIVAGAIALSVVLVLGRMFRRSPKKAVESGST